MEARWLKGSNWRAQLSSKVYRYNKPLSDSNLDELHLGQTVAAGWTDSHTDHKYALLGSWLKLNGNVIT